VCDVSDHTMSTRIIIKNLPHNITPIRLKEHFSSSQSGNAFFSANITDAKLVTDPKSGRSRGFAFVGYRTADEAQKAVEWFNDTFVDMRKVSVEIAKPVCVLTLTFLILGG
jgi:multiple RNA-binding domain-containing protein 1